MPNIPFGGDRQNYPTSFDKSITVTSVPTSIDLSSSISAHSADKNAINQSSGVSMAFDIQPSNFSYDTTLTGNVTYVARVWRDPLYTQIYVNSGNASVNFAMPPYGWQLVNGNWYYYDNYVLVKGWKSISSTWYYLNTTSGAMQTGWVTIGGKSYYLNSPNGDMAVNTITPDGYRVGTDGAWIP